MITVKQINQSAHATLNLKILLTNYVHIADIIRTQVFMNIGFARARKTKTRGDPPNEQYFNNY